MRREQRARTPGRERESAFRNYNRSMLVRPATAADCAAIQAIYAPHVLHGLASFEEPPPSVQEIRGRFDEVTARGLPYLAAEESGEVLGYCYCSLYTTRSAHPY